MPATARLECTCGAPEPGQLREHEVGDFAVEVGILVQALGGLAVHGQRTYETPLLLHDTI